MDRRRLPTAPEMRNQGTDNLDKVESCHVAGTVPAQRQERGGAGKECVAQMCKMRKANGKARIGSGRHRQMDNCVPVLCVRRHYAMKFMGSIHKVGRHLTQATALFVFRNHARRKCDRGMPRCEVRAAPGRASAKPVPD